ncbi:MAG TPA: hypothetical protein GX708_03845 [Gallicola sp.]|nr:hypothetical protein [Gallicola sp.]
MKKLNENEILDKVIYYLEEYAAGQYGVLEYYQYNNLIGAISDLRDYRAGYIKHFNDMRTDARCYYTDVCYILEIEEMDPIEF